MQFPPFSVTSFLFGPNILLSTLFSNTLSLCSSFNVRDQLATNNEVPINTLETRRPAEKQNLVCSFSVNIGIELKEFCQKLNNVILIPLFLQIAKG
jgi:hypothetical protein